MRSLRLSDKLDAQVRRAAAGEGASVSEFLRRAASERVGRTLSADPAERLSYAIGAVAGHGGDLARDTGEAFAEILEEKHRPRSG
jgi:Ribbon-helix-helix protein, copG family